MGLPPTLLPRMKASARPLADVRVHGLQRRSGDRIGRPWVVRWKVEGRSHSRSFRVRPEAERFRTGLFIAQQDGEEFDPATGEPVSWAPQPDEARLHEWARTWLAEQWDEWAPRTRVSMIEALVRFIPLAVPADAPAPPPGLRSHLKAWLPPGGVVTDEACAAWLDARVLPLGRLTRAVLAEVDRGLGLRDDGTPFSPSVSARLRKIARGCTRRAVDLEILPTDPWPPPPRGRAQRKSARSKRSVSIRSLPDPSMMARIIESIPNGQPASLTYRTMTAVAYYAGLRPSEVIALRASALDLPSDGWGRVHVTEAETGEDEPGEPKTGAREVPIPPQLVEILRRWVDEKNLTADAFLFRTRHDNPPALSNWWRALRRATDKAGAPSMRIYDCRHAAATTWLRAGVPLGEVAKRMGHSVETLVSTYVGALDTDESLANTRITEVLAGAGTS
jgi:integrase